MQLNLTDQEAKYLYSLLYISTLSLKKNIPADDPRLQLSDRLQKEIIEHLAVVEYGQPE